MKFGFLSGIGEITPSIFSGLDRIDKTRIFLILYNCCAQNGLKIPLIYAYSGLNLEEIFLKRIKDLCEFKNLSRSKISSFCFASNAVICAYRSGKFDDIPPLAVSSKHPVAKLILLVKSQNGICFDADTMFSQFVYDKINAKHFDKNVYFQDGIIFAEQDGRKLFGVVPCFKEITKERFHLANREIARGFEALSGGEFDKMFIVAPRNANFSRYIEVRWECGRGESLRLVPYTISHHIF